MAPHRSGSRIKENHCLKCRAAVQNEFMQRANFCAVADDVQVSLGFICLFPSPCAFLHPEHPFHRAGCPRTELCSPSLHSNVCTWGKAGRHQSCRSLAHRSWGLVVRAADGKWLNPSPARRGEVNVAINRWAQEMRH